MHDFETRVAAAKRAIRAASVDGVQRRTIPAKLEVRKTDSGGWQIVGHGIVYNSLSENLGGFREQIAEGAADDVLAKSPDIRGLINHNPDLILGRTTAGTMAVEDDAPQGVRYVIDPPDTSYANDLHVSMDRGDITQSSYAFRVGRDGDRWDEDPETGGLIRTITRFSDLFDMSPVTYPAYLTTDAGTSSRSDDEDDETPSQDDGEREPKADAQEQGEVAPSDDEQADDAETPRLLAVRRRMKAAQDAGLAPSE